MPTTVPPTAPPQRLPFTGDEEADRLIATDPNALLIGFVLDQQVLVQKAFSGPLVIRQRLGTIDPVELASMDPERMRAAFAQPPAVHRFPAAMADRVRDLCAALARDHDGDAGRIWREAADGRDLARRLGALPGVGPLKTRTIIALLGRQFGVRPPGWEREAAPEPTLGAVTTPEELAAYQAQKRAAKAAARAQAGTGARGGRR